MARGVVVFFFDLKDVNGFYPSYEDHGHRLLSAGLFLTIYFHVATDI